jgi:hypothetical protein
MLIPKHGMRSERNASPRMLRMPVKVLCCFSEARSNFPGTIAAERCQAEIKTEKQTEIKTLKLSEPLGHQ